MEMKIVAFVWFQWSNNNRLSLYQHVSNWGWRGWLSQRVLATFMLTKGVSLIEDAHGRHNDSLLHSLRGARLLFRFLVDWFLGRVASVVEQVRKSCRLQMCARLSMLWFNAHLIGWTALVDLAWKGHVWQDHRGDVLSERMAFLGSGLCVGFVK